MALQFAVGGALLPFISMILRDRGLDFRQISVVFLAASSTLLVFPFLWGMLADRYLPLNRLFALLNVGACVALTALLVQRSYVGPLLSFMLFFACFTPTLTLVNALSFHFLHDPRTQFGMVRAWGSLGWIIPSLPIYLWFALAEKAGFDFVVLLAMGFALAMAALALFLPHAPPGAGRRTGNGQLAYWPAMKRLIWPDPIHWRRTRDRPVPVAAAFFWTVGLSGHDFRRLPRVVSPASPLQFLRQQMAVVRQLPSRRRRDRVLQHRHQRPGQLPRHPRSARHSAVDARFLWLRHGAHVRKLGRGPGGEGSRQRSPSCLSPRREFGRISGAVDPGPRAKA